MAVSQYQLATRSRTFAALKRHRTCLFEKTHIIEFSNFTKVITEIMNGNLLFGRTRSSTSFAKAYPPGAIRTLICDKTRIAKLVDAVETSVRDAKRKM